MSKYTDTLVSSFVRTVFFSLKLSAKGTPTVQACIVRGNKQRCSINIEAFDITSL